MIKNSYCSNATAPLIRWAGSKRKLLPIILERMPRDFKRYIEPFAGSACLFFAVEPKEALISDMNPHLIDAYSTITKHPIRVLHLAQSLPSTANGYYSVRNDISKSQSKIQRAARFLFLNRYCFNALYRTNKLGHFNVPFGSRTGGFPSDESFRRAALILARASIRCCDFQTTIGQARRGDFVYLDPPYVTSRRIDRTEYGPGSFSVGDIPRLASSLHALHAVGARFLLSYSASQDLLSLLPRKITGRLRVQRHIAAAPTKRKVVSEILVDNLDVFGSYP
jgi:DNA adenine methylase